MSELLISEVKDYKYIKGENRLFYCLLRVSAGWLITGNQFLQLLVEG